MPVVRAKISSKGQVTLPVELRRHLKLATGDEVAFEFGSGERAEVAPVRRRPASAFSGAFASLAGPIELRELRRNAWRGRARALERSRQRRGKK